MATAGNWFGGSACGNSELSAEPSLGRQASLTLVTTEVTFRTWADTSETAEDSGSSVELLPEGHRPSTTGSSIGAAAAAERGLPLGGGVEQCVARSWEWAPIQVQSVALLEGRIWSEPVKNFPSSVSDRCSQVPFRAEALSNSMMICQ